MAAGSWFGLPELGISELLGGNKASTSKKTVTVNNYVPEQKPVYGPPAPTTTNNKTNTTTNKTTTSSNKSSSSGSSSNKSSSSNNSAQKEAQKAADEARKAAQSAIRNKAETLRSGLTSLESQVPQYQAEDEQYVTDQYGNMLNNYQSQYDQSLGLLGNKREAIGTYKEQATQEMGQDMRNSLLASQMKLGAIGGGNSSASEVMLPYAFSKESGKQRASIIGQANDQYATLDNEEINLKAGYDQGKKEIDNWKITALDNVRQTAREKLDRIQQAKLQATADEQDALANMEIDVLNNAQSMLAQIQAEDRNRRTNLENWATQRMAQLQDYKLQLSNTTNFNPQQMTYDALDVGNFGGASNNSYIPYVPKRKKNEYSA